MDEDANGSAPLRGGDKRGAAWVELAKDDVGALWQQLLNSGQQPSEWTNEQLDEAFTQVQNTKHRKTEAGFLSTGGASG